MTGISWSGSKMAPNKVIRDSVFHCMSVCSCFYFTASKGLKSSGIYERLNFMDSGEQIKAGVVTRRACSSHVHVCLRLLRAISSHVWYNSLYVLMYYAFRAPLVYGVSLYSCMPAVTSDVLTVSFTFFCLVQFDLVWFCTGS